MMLTEGEVTEGEGGMVVADDDAKAAEGEGGGTVVVEQGAVVAEGECAVVAVGCVEDDQICREKPVFEGG